MPQDPGQPEDADRDEDHVLTADRQQVVEPGGTEARPVGRATGPRPRRARCPSRTARRSPVEPGRERAARARRERGPRSRRSRRAAPRSASRVPMATTWTPCRRSQVRSSKPVRRGPRKLQPRAELEDRALGRRRGRPGARAAPARAAPIATEPHERAGTRSSKPPLRAGPVTTSDAGSASPTCATSTLESRASSRALPHHQPASASASASGGDSRARVARRARQRPAAATASSGPRLRSPGRVRGGEPETGSAREHVRIVAQQVIAGPSTLPSEAALTAPPGRAAARPVPGRCPGPRRARRPNGRRRAPCGSRGSSAP